MNETIDAGFVIDGYSIVGNDRKVGCGVVMAFIWNCNSPHNIIKHETHEILCYLLNKRSHNAKFTSIIHDYKSKVIKLFCECHALKISFCSQREYKPSSVKRIMRNQHLPLIDIEVCQ